MKSLLFLFTLITVVSCQSPSTSSETVVNSVADANGYAKFNSVSFVEFTFNVQRDTMPASSRHWQWKPKTNEITIVTDSGNTTFKRYDTSNAQLVKLNKQFTNDEYWLLFPFHLRWDAGVTIIDSNMQQAPISNKPMHLVTAQYNNIDGFTPGDSYDLYIDENHRIQEWAYHKSGAAEPSLVTTWQDFKDFGGITVAQDHRSKDGKFRLWFTGVNIK